MNYLEYQYNGEPIDFAFREDLMVNATEMSKIFGKELKDFMRTETCKKLITALENSNIRPDRSGKSSLRSEGNDKINGTVKHKTADLVPLVIIKIGGPNGGETWVHRYLAIELASWLDINFKIWTLRIIDSLLSGYVNERRDLAIRKINTDNQLNKILNESESEEVKKIKKLLAEKKQIKGEEFNANKRFKKDLFS